MNTHHDPISFEKLVIKSLKGFRRSKKITQTEIANRIGVSRDTIARIESGKARIYLAQVVAIADALDVTLQDLLMQDEQEEEMIMEADESMSVSQQNVRIKFISQPMISSPTAKVLPDAGRIQVGISNTGGDAEGRRGLQASEGPTAPATATIPNPYLNQPAVEIYGESMKNYILNHRLFWHWIPEDKLTGLSISSVVEATLMQGKSSDIRWLFDTIGVVKAAEVFRRQIMEPRHGYPKMTKDYFEAYFNRHAPEI